MGKQDLLNAARAAHDDLIAAVEPLDEATMSTTAFGDWNLKQLLAHMGGWPRLNAEMMERMARGEPPVPEGGSYPDNPDGMNATFAAETNGKTAPEVVQSLRDAFTRLTRAAESLPEERFEVNRSAAKMLQGNGINHVRQHLNEIEAFIVSRLLPPGASILEIGCGDGELVQTLAGLGFQVTGVDRSRPRIASAKKATPAAQFVAKDILSCKFKERSFDAAFSFYSVPAVPGKEFSSLLAMVVPWLREGAYFFFTTRFEEDLPPEFPRQPSRFFTRESLGEMLNSHGMSLEAEYSAGILARRQS
jgi:SAM-dependent methyltransferase